MARTTLELLLDSIKERDEEQPNRLPVLPQRPTSRARLPSRKRNSAAFLDQSFDLNMKQRFSHGTDASNGNRQHEDGLSPPLRHSWRKETEIKSGIVQNEALKKATQNEALTKATQPCIKERGSKDNGGLGDTELAPKKQDPAQDPELASKKQGAAPAYASPKRSWNGHQLHELQKVCT